MAKILGEISKVKIDFFEKWEFSFWKKDFHFEKQWLQELESNFVDHPPSPTNLPFKPIWFM